LTEAETMMAVFDRRDVAGRLLILGEPGAGKTTTLLELAQELVAQAETDDSAPVPIIFELSNWTQDSQAIDQWLVAQLKEEYNVAPKVAQHWLATHQILPLLDGLDELGGVRLPKCVHQLNAWLPDSEPDRQAVVCCRTKEFRRGEVKLTGLNGAVELQPLSDGQIQDYLASVNQPHLWADTIEPSADLTDLARTPLMLTVMAVALANRPAKTQPEIFAAYIDERFVRYEAQHGTLPYSRRKTEQYLRRLATQLKAQKQTTFLIETMQPGNWLQTAPQKWAYRLIFGLIFGLIVGLIVGLIFGLIGGLIGGLIFGLIGGLIFGLIVGLIGGLI
jgi:F0F1-type ATP synthase assembly protein I